MTQSHNKEADYARLVEVVEGANQVDKALDVLSSRARHELCSFVTGNMPTEERLSKARVRNAEMYERGVSSRTIYLAEAREHEPTLAHVAWLNEQGAEVRTLPDLPMQLIIFDAKTAVLPFITKSKKHAIIIHRDPSVIYCLQALFELIWTSAAPLGRIFDSDGREISFRERALLEMLSLGRIDKEIASDYGISVRTVATNVANLMDRLNADTRFAAGVQAAKRNWV